jgi:hypothetical protein
MEKHITLPLTEELARTLKAGDIVYLTGEIYTSRDAGHKRMCETLAKGENLPFDPNGTYGYLVVMPPCFLEKKDTLKDYRERLSSIARHADIPLAYLWEQWKDVPVLLNKMLFRQSYLEETVSASGHLVSNPVWYKGSDIMAANLLHGMGEYRLEILHADSASAMRKMEELSQMFRKKMELLTGKQV